MSRVRTASTLLLLALTVAGCSSTSSTSAPGASGPSTADLAAINALRAGFVTATNAGDAAAITALYTADAVVMQENAPSVNGKDAILPHYQALFAANTAKLTLTSQETKVAGDWAFDRGQFTFELTPKALGGMAVSEQGKYLVIVQKLTDGSWKLAREIGNSNAMMMPPPAVTPAATKSGTMGTTRTK